MVNRSRFEDYFRDVGAGVGAAVATRCDGTRYSSLLPVGSVAQEGIQGVGEDLCPVEENGMCHMHHLLHCKEVKHIAAA